MTRRTQTKRNRIVFDQVGENPVTKKPIIEPTKEFMPPQDRQWVEFTALDGRKCGAFVSAGQAINKNKFFKKPRKYDNDKKLWV